MLMQCQTIFKKILLASQKIRFFEPPQQSPTTARAFRHNNRVKKVDGRKSRRTASVLFLLSFLFLPGKISA
jgi:hypothetical protein